MDFSKDFAILYAVARYKHSPFALSMSALQMFFEPYHTRFLRAFSSYVRLVPWQLRCVFANPRIARLEPKKIVSSGLKNAMAVIALGNPTARPRFFPGPNSSGRLYLGGRQVRRIKAESTAICAILQAFEENGWPEQMETDGLLGLDAAHAARDVVKKLNGRQRVLPKIRFEDINSGRVIRWEVVIDE
jgi:hypothetical protein